jgi:hypothetical protein
MTASHRYFDDLLVEISKIFKLGLMPQGVRVICKGHECNEHARLGVSLCHPVQDGGLSHARPNQMASGEGDLRYTRKGIFLYRDALKS